MNGRQNTNSCYWYGIVLGLVLGTLEAVISLRLWLWMGSPDFLVRPQQVTAYGAFMPLAGAVAGAFFGLVLLRLRCFKIRDFTPVFLLSVLLGVVFYLAFYFVMLRYRLALFFVPDACLFAAAAWMARVILRRRGGLSTTAAP